MHQDMLQHYQSYILRRKRRSILRKIVNVLACTVIFCTTYALILPAITMEKETFCGVEEHVHSDKCYGNVSVTKLTCTAEKLNIHTHSAGCYDAEGALCCGQADYVVHTHEGICFDAEGNLICTIAQRGAHVHGESCYVPGETQPAVLHVHSETCNVSRKGALICTLEEYEGHSHSAGCYIPGEALICGIEENHVHGDGCYEYPLICTLSTAPHVHDGSCRSRGELICAETEEHEHNDNCYESLLTCGKADGEAHAHGEGCYSTEARLVCAKAENHVHSDSCHETVLNCQLPEDPGHAHSDDCYEWETVPGCGLEEGQEEPTEPAEPVLVCTEPTAQEHIHGDSCFEIVTADAKPICGNAAIDHTHSNECYEATCGLDAHSHGLACYSNPEADVETAEIWETTFADVELTGKWHEDIVAIAETQLGYAESARNYAVWEDNTTHGYTRYGQWYGSPYGDWCAMFTSFCLHYADVEGMPLHWGVRPWIEELTELKLYHEAEVYEPKAGDIVFYDWEDDGLSDHVGIVAEIVVHEDDEETEEDEKTIRVKAIEGNSSNRVQYVYYEIDDPRLLGYSELPDNPEVYSCGILRHSHNEYCYDEEGKFICREIEHLHTEECEPRDERFCGLEEHSHLDSCYDAEGNLVCELTEHIHNETCTEEAPEAVELVIWYCGQEEHTHDETCCNEAGELVCELPGHTHTEECAAEPVTYHCGMEAHTHSEECYDEAGELTCELSEHTHSEECRSEPVIRYCGLEEHTHDAACYDDAGELVCELSLHTHDETCLIQTICFCGLQEHTHAETCYNEAGELVCEIPVHTHSDGCTVPGGYVCGLEAHVHDENCYDAEGSFICTLPEHSHTEDCEARNAYACGMAEHTHGEDCYNAEGDLICRLPEHLHTAACVGRNLYYSDPSIRVHAVIQGVENLPRKLTLMVKPVVPEENPDSFTDLQSAVSSQIDSNKHLSQATFFDMYLLSEGDIYELPETALVTVTMEFAEPIFTEEEMADADSTQAFMLTPEGGMQLPEEKIVEEPAAEEANPSAMQEAVDSVVSAITDAVSSLIPSAEATELETPEGEGEGKETVYQIDPLNIDSYGEQEKGITSITFQTNQIATFGVFNSAKTVVPELWERVWNTSELNNTDTYMIVSVEGNFALTATSTQNKNDTAVHLTTVKNNVEYYQIVLPGYDASGKFAPEDVTSDLFWSFEPSGNGFKVKAKNTALYINLSKENPLSSSSQPITLTKMGPEKSWQLTNGTDTGAYGLSYTGESNASFGRSNYTNTNYKAFNKNWDMLIFKASSKKLDDLTIPEDVKSPKNTGSQDGTSGTKTKPNYAEEMPHQVPTGAVTDDALLSCYDGENQLICGLEEHSHNAACAENCPKLQHTHKQEVTGTAFADSATSNIEAQFREADFQDNYANDGKVLTDKSVTYGRDDYGAFANYEANTFGVTLSAIGQAYKTPEIQEIPAPLDVVFILDCSGSMSGKSSGESQDRMLSMIEAMNTTMAHLFKPSANPNFPNENRAGVVTYSRGSDIFLPLGKYSASDGKFFQDVKLNTKNYYGKDYSNTYIGIAAGDTLVDKDGNSPSNLGGDNIYQAFGTYTQLGIANAYKVFFDNIDDNIDDDTTVTYTVNGKDYVVRRQPVFILLSDGEPTYSTNIYMDALKGPHYGDGDGGTLNSKGIHGYYTILSANYYKQLVSNLYKTPAKFYTVGLSITAPEESNPDGPKIGTLTGDNYRRAVLNPDPEDIAELTESLESPLRQKDTNEMLQSLLYNTYASQSVVTKATWPEEQLGIPHAYTPVLKNHPYGSDYDYADASFFGSMDSTVLANHFIEIINDSIVMSPYSFILYEGSSVDLVDNIGAGMEVKGAPKLHFYGKTYEHTSTVTVNDNITKYIYGYVVTDPHANPSKVYDLSNIDVTVTTSDADGNVSQTVKIFIPADALPVFTPTNEAASYDASKSYTDKELAKMYYYEALPVRLIYQVGLTEESEQKILSMQDNPEEVPEGRLVFFTNQYDDENGTAGASASLKPSTNNPYFLTSSIDGTTTKVSNTTGTAGFVSSSTSSTGTNGEKIIISQLGNNGKLVFQLPTVEIPVEKRWIGVQADDQNPVTVNLYKVKGTIAELVDTIQPITLSKDNQWKNSFENVPIPAEDEFYAIGEVKVNGFATLYEGETEKYTLKPEAEGDTGKTVTLKKVIIMETVVSEEESAVSTEGDAAPSSGKNSTTAETVVIKNVPAIDLPRTGGMGTIPYTTGGIALIMAAIILLLYNHKFRREDLPF